MRFLRLLEGTPGVIERLLRHLVRRQVILFTVVHSGSPMGVSGPLMHFRSYLM